MKKIQTVEMISIVVAAIGIVLFWIFGSKGLLNWAAYSLVVAGVSAWIGVVAFIIDALRSRHF